jgi:hypothetical protein
VCEDLAGGAGTIPEIGGVLLIVPKVHVVADGVGKSTDDRLTMRIVNGSERDGKASRCLMPK